MPLLNRGAQLLLSSLPREASLLSAILLKAAITDFWGRFFVISDDVGEDPRTDEELLFSLIFLTVFVELEALVSVMIARRVTTGPRGSLGTTMWGLASLWLRSEFLHESGPVSINYFHFIFRLVTKASFSWLTIKGWLRLADLGMEPKVTSESHGYCLSSIISSSTSSLTSSLSSSSSYTSSSSIQSFLAIEQILFAATRGP